MKRRLTTVGIRVQFTFIVIAVLLLSTFVGSYVLARRQSQALRESIASGGAIAGAPEPSRAPVHVGGMIGVVSLPRPADLAVLVRIVDLFGVGFGYSDFPAFIAE